MTIQPHAKACPCCKSCAPCPDHEAHRAIPRETLTLGGQEFSLTVTELLELKSRVMSAIVVLRMRGGGA